MKPSRIFKSTQPLTLNGLVTDMRALGADRAALVRPAQEGKPAGLAIFLLSAASIRDCGPYLREVAAGITQPEGGRIMIDGDSNLGTILEAMEQHRLQWQWSTINGDKSTLLIFLVGPVVTETLAAELTRRGVIVNLK